MLHVPDTDIDGHFLLTEEDFLSGSAPRLHLRAALFHVSDDDGEDGDIPALVNDSDSSDDEDTASVHTSLDAPLMLTRTMSSDPRLLFFPSTINGIPIRALLDSAASHFCLHPRLVERLQLQITSFFFVVFPL
jgi:hypothetical protein